MGFDSGQGDLVPALALCVGYHADRLFLVLQDRSLLYVGLEVGMDITAADFVLPGIVDPLQFFAHGPAVLIGARQAIVQVEDPGEDARCDHGGGKAGAFLVGPNGDLDRAFGFVAKIVQRPHDFQPRQYTEDSIEPTAGWLGIQVATGDHRGQVVVAPRAAGENVAHLVDPDAATGALAPLHEEIPALFVEIGQRQAAAAAFFGGSDLGHLHQAVPKPLAVDG